MGSRVAYLSFDFLQTSRVPIAPRPSRRPRRRLRTHPRVQAVRRLAGWSYRGHHRSAPGELFSETDNSMAVLLTYGTARVLLGGGAEAKEEEYMANGSYTRP